MGITHQAEGPQGPTGPTEPTGPTGPQAPTLASLTLVTDITLSVALETTVTGMTTTFLAPVSGSVDIVCGINTGGTNNNSGDWWPEIQGVAASRRAISTHYHTASPRDGGYTYHRVSGLTPSATYTVRLRARTRGPSMSILAATSPDTHYATLRVLEVL